MLYARVPLFLYVEIICFPGESNVYTLGNIGAHRVVSTKLPSVGHTRAAMIAAGNTTTRLLGMMQLLNLFKIILINILQYIQFRTYFLFSLQARFKK